MVRTWKDVIFSARDYGSNGSVLLMISCLIGLFAIYISFQVGTSDPVNPFTIVVYSLLIFGLVFIYHALTMIGFRINRPGIGGGIILSIVFTVISLFITIVSGTGFSSVFAEMIRYFLGIVVGAGFLWSYHEMYILTCQNDFIYSGLLFLFGFIIPFIGVVFTLVATIVSYGAWYSLSSNRRFKHILIFRLDH